MTDDQFRHVIDTLDLLLQAKQVCDTAPRFDTQQDRQDFSAVRVKILQAKNTLKKMRKRELDRSERENKKEPF